MPSGPTRESALESFLQWCGKERLSPLLFGCELGDLPALEGWELTEIGKQPLFQAGPKFRPELSGQEQPPDFRYLRRQARRARSKGVVMEELSIRQIWSLSHSDSLKEMMHHRWSRRGLAEFSFLVEFHLEMGLEQKKIYAARSAEGHIVSLVVLTPCRRGWLLEHHILSPLAPNGTGELMLCLLLSEYLDEGTWLSLGITPLWRELHGEAGDGPIKGVLGFLPPRLVRTMLRWWEPLYGFQRLASHRARLQAQVWEPVYWAVEEKKVFSDILLVLRAFAGGSFFRFGLATGEKLVQLASRKLSRTVLPALNWFYIVTLLVWIPILWNLNGEQMFGSPQACKVWAIYDLVLVGLFILHQRVASKIRPSFLTDLLLGMVAADTVLAWIQTALFHGGLPSGQPVLALLLFLVNTAPVSAVVFLSLVKFAAKPLPFLRRELPIA